MAFGSSRELTWGGGVGRGIGGLFKSRVKGAEVNNETCRDGPEGGGSEGDS